ncbi:MAG: hypothetical protein KTR31_28725 [Myxococcales bacterium]|nr:hypothetical protein [Myxococcales bacterium]
MTLNRVLPLLVLSSLGAAPATIGGAQMCDYTRERDCTCCVERTDYRWQVQCCDTELILHEFWNTDTVPATCTLYDVEWGDRDMSTCVPGRCTESVEEPVPKADPPTDPILDVRCPDVVEMVPGPWLEHVAFTQCCEECQVDTFKPQVGGPGGNIECVVDTTYTVVKNCTPGECPDHDPIPPRDDDDEQPPGPDPM